MKMSGRILVFLFILTSACTINSVGFGGCAGAHCYEIKHLPANWRGSSSFNPDGEYEQTFSGPEGTIYVTTTPSHKGVSVPDLVREYINQLPGTIDYEKEVINTKHGDMILIQLAHPGEDGKACFAVLPRFDGQPIVAKGYPENDQVTQLCQIFYKVIPTYTTSASSPEISSTAKLSANRPATTATFAPTETAIATTEQPDATPSPAGTRVGDIEASPAITITGRVRGVVPADEVIVLDSEATEGRQAFLLQMHPESALYGLDNQEIDLTGIEEGMIIQVVGHEQEEGILLAGRIRILALPTPGPPPVQGSPTPVGPITLADVSPEWEAYDFPEFGIQLSAPAAWEMSRMPGGYFFAPAAEQGHQYPTQLTVGHRLNVPTEPEAMATAIVEQWQRLTPTADFYAEPIIVDGYEGIALWSLSPYSCVNVYVAAHGVVYEINFYSAFCNEAGDELTDLGQSVLDSMVLYEPTASP